jgi:outer membrane protein assembly factor BamB
MKKESMITVFLFCFILSVVAVPQTTANTSDDWPMFHHDLGHTGYSTSNGPVTKRTLWTFTTDGAVSASPAVVDGVVYIGSDDEFVYALNAFTGSLEWSYNTNGPVEEAATVLEGVVYVGGFHSHAVFALNASTGDLIWKQPVDSAGPNSNSATAVAKGLVFITVYIRAPYEGGALYALNAQTGAQAWNYTKPAWFSAPPAVSGDTVYVTTEQGDIIALDVASGSVQWDAFPGGILHGSPSIADGRLYIDSINQKAFALDVTNGNTVWSGRILRGVSKSCPAIADGVLYVSSTAGGTPETIQDGAVSALNATTGETLWNKMIGSIVASSP